MSWSELSFLRARLEGEWEELSGQVDELGDYWGDHLETVGQQMGSRWAEKPEWRGGDLSLVQIHPDTDL